MRRGIFIPAVAVRIAVGTMVVAATAMVVATAPDAMRYLKMKTM